MTGVCRTQRRTYCTVSTRWWQLRGTLETRNSQTFISKTVKCIQKPSLSILSCLNLWRQVVHSLHPLGSWKIKRAWDHWMFRLFWVLCGVVWASKDKTSPDAESRAVYKVQCQGFACPTRAILERGWGWKNIAGIRLRLSVWRFRMDLVDHP